MYFYRFLNKIKRTVKNKAHPEGSICEAYLAQETAHFCSYYFSPNVDCVRTRIARNQDVEGRGESSQGGLSIFEGIGRASGKTTRRYLTDQEARAARLYVLLNCDEVQPFLELYTSILQDSGYSQIVISQQIEETFPDWFKQHVHDPSNNITDQALIDLAWGPLRAVLIWPIYVVNGYRFHIKSLAEIRNTDNSGVFVKGNTHANTEGDYYGVLKEVVQVHYPGSVERTIFLFNCEWFDPTPNRGTRTHPRYGITELKITRRYGKFDPFVIANQAHQCYYAPYPGRKRDKIDWVVVIKTRPRAIVETNTSLEVAHQAEEMFGFISTEPNTEQMSSLADMTAPFEEFDAIEATRLTVELEDEDDESEAECSDSDDLEDSTDQNTTDIPSLASDD